MATASRTIVSAPPTSISHATEPGVVPNSTSPVPFHSAGHWALRVAPWLRNDPWRGRAIVAIKVVHSLVFFVEELSVGYLLYAGLRQRQGRAAAVAAGAIAAESAIYFANGQRCPLAQLAEELGAEHGSVTDIYLPHWIAKRIFTYNAPLVVVIVLLHTRVFLARHHERRSGVKARLEG
jgi:hypothetical protein